MNDTRKKQWPRIYTIQRLGRQVFQVDLRAVNGGRPLFDTRQAADTCAEQARLARANEDISFFYALPQQAKLDAVKAYDLLKPFGATIIEAATNYKNKYLVFKTAPLIKDIVAQLIKEKNTLNLRPRTLADLRSRLQNNFAVKFGHLQLTDLSLEDLKNWLLEVQHFTTRKNFHKVGKLLYNFAIKNTWIDTNYFEKIDPPKVFYKSVEYYTVEQAHKLLIAANELGLVYVCVGLFAGIRDEEMKRLRGKHFNFDTKIITLDSDIIKTRSRRRIIEMNQLPALLAWLEPFKDKIKGEFRIAEQNKQRKTRVTLIKKSGLTSWIDNGLRHTCISMHFAMFENAGLTAKIMGNSESIIHDHYKALVSKAVANKYWNLRP